MPCNVGAIQSSALLSVGPWQSAATGLPACSAVSQSEVRRSTYSRARSELYRKRHTVRFRGE